MCDCVVWMDGQDRRGEGEGEIVNVWGRDEKCETEEKNRQCYRDLEFLEARLDISSLYSSAKTSRKKKSKSNNYIYLGQLVIIFAHLCQ